MNEKNMTKNLTIMLLAMISCALWGSAPSCIKLGYELFQIRSTETMNILLFAGCRFTIAGILVILGASMMARKLIIPKKTSWSAVLALAMAQTVIQYLLYYIGAAHASGVKVSILSGSTAFFSVVIACLIFRQEKLTVNKFFGCLAGLLGIILVNLQGASETLTWEMSITGEGFILLSSLSSALSSVLIRQFSQENDPVMLSGYQFTLGGCMLIVVACFNGGHLPQITAAGLGMLLYLGFLSAVAYTLWSLLLQYNPVSRVTVYQCMMPIFGVIFSTIILGEGSIFSVMTLVSLLLVCFGIWLVNFVKKN